MTVWKSAVALIGLSIVASPILAQESKSYPDGRGNDIVFPMGDLSFADEVVTFTPGTPPPPPEQEDPAKTLGTPNYTSGGNNELTLGCGGTVVLRFVDNALVNINGPDLFVFEVGPDVEATALSISIDGNTWVDVGRIEGATAAVDIENFITPGDTFSYVKLEDQRVSCGSRFPGADIDAVGAIGAARRVVLDAAVLFDFDKFNLKPEALVILQDLASELEKFESIRLVVEGHTDAVGTDAYNLRLSDDRANSVREFLAKQDNLSKDLIESAGFGEARPIKPNDSDENREQNRRVEILIIFDQP